MRLEGTRKTEVGLDLPLPDGRQRDARASTSSSGRASSAPWRTPSRPAAGSSLIDARATRGAAVLAHELSGTLSHAIEQPARPERRAARGGRCWRLWLEAEQPKRGSQFEAAHEALKASSAIAEALEWTHGTAPLWYVEAEALRGALLQDEGTRAPRSRCSTLALRGWLYVGAALAGGADAELHGCGARRRPDDGDRAGRRGSTEAHAAAAMFAEDRFVPQITEVAARASS